jgi:hypothetical protein
VKIVLVSVILLVLCGCHKRQPSQVTWARQPDGSFTATIPIDKNHCPGTWNEKDKSCFIPCMSSDPTFCK